MQQLGLSLLYIEFGIHLRLIGYILQQDENRFINKTVSLKINPEQLIINNIYTLNSVIRPLLFKSMELLSIEL